MLCAFALAIASAGIARAQPKKPRRSLAKSDANGMTIMLEEMRRADKRRRDDILKMEMEAERRERSDRTVIFGVVAVAVVAVIVVEKRRLTRTRRGAPRPTP
jgi:hypothetical protein